MCARYCRSYRSAFPECQHFSTSRGVHDRTREAFDELQTPRVRLKRQRAPHWERSAPRMRVRLSKRRIHERHTCPRNLSFHGDTWSVWKKPDQWEWLQRLRIGETTRRHSWRSASLPLPSSPRPAKLGSVDSCTALGNNMLTRGGKWLLWALSGSIRNGLGLYSAGEFVGPYYYTTDRAQQDTSTAASLLSLCNRWQMAVWPGRYEEGFL